MRTKWLLIVAILVGSIAVQAHASIVDLEASFMRKDYTQTQQIGESMLSSGELTEPERLEVEYFLGMSEFRLGEISPAIKRFQRIIKSEPEVDLRDKAYIGLFDAYYHQERYRKAWKTIKELINESPRSHYSSLIYLKAGRVNIKLSNWKLAKYYLNEIVDRFPNSFEYHTAKQLLEEKQYFAVQVGAFVERDRAEQVMQALQQRGEYAYIVETMDRDNTRFYRVRVGQMGLLRKAERLKSKLSKLGYPTRIYP